MEKIRRSSWIFLVIILFFGFLLRNYNLDTIPRHGATFDEFAWTWLGINLIQNKVPSSWSSHPQYKNKQFLKYQGADFWIVKPYLEHPPLFGLIAGSFAMISGAKDMYHVTLEKIRPLGLTLGILSIVLVFFFTKQIYGTSTALISSLIYSSVPTIVIGSRLVQNENFLIPVWLLSLFFLNSYLKTGNKWMRNSSFFLSAILPLAKIPWVVAPISLVGILLYKNKRKEALALTLITIVFFTFFIFYGLYFDKELFINLWKLQIARYDISFSGLFSIFTNPLLVDRYYLDGWIFFGWMSIFLLLGDFKKHFMILTPFLTYLLIFIFAIPNEPAHGWYRYPFYPFIIISTAVLLKEEFVKPTLRTVFFVLIVGLSLMFNTWEQAFGFSYTIYRLSVLFFFLPVLFFILQGKYFRFIKYFLIISLFLFTILNIFAVINFYG